MLISISISLAGRHLSKNVLIFAGYFPIKRSIICLFMAVHCYARYRLSKNDFGKKASENQQNTSSNIEVDL